jgi:hypothetical protein
VRRLRFDGSPVVRTLVIPILIAFSVTIAAPVAGSGEVAIPAAPGALAANLSSDALLSWLEPVADREGYYRLRYAPTKPDGGWGSPVTITEGDRFFANWADLPAVQRLSGGSFVAHWLEKTGSDPYAYGVRIARSADGKTWKEAGWLHEDRSETEHGFVSWVPLPEGGIWAFWLDGNAMASGGPMEMRGTLLSAEGDPTKEAETQEKILDPRVCECCTTGAALAENGPVVVYRGRSDDEIRDIRIVRRTASGWSSPKTVADDGWRIAGCPVNGPAVAAVGQRVVVAWFTAADDRPRVLLAISTDGGASFAAPVEISGDGARGRVDVALAEDGTAVVSWLGRQDGKAAVLLRSVSPEGRPGPIHSAAATSGARSSGFPRIALVGEDLRVVWRNTEGAAGLHGVRWKIDQLNTSRENAAAPQPASQQAADRR